MWKKALAPILLIPKKGVKCQRINPKHAYLRRLVGRLTCVNRRCLREILWFLGLTDSLCLAAVLSRRGTDCGTESRLMDSMVPVGGRTRLDLGDFTGVL